MFGRRRRVAPVVPPAPELSDDMIYDLLHDKLAELIGPNGQWTLVPRGKADTDVIFHGLKARQVAASLTNILRTGKAVLRGEAPPAPMAPVEPAAEPTVLSWTPGPISVWAEPTRHVPASSVPASSVPGGEPAREQTVVPVASGRKSRTAA